MISREAGRTIPAPQKVAVTTTAATVTLTNGAGDYLLRNTGTGAIAFLTTTTPTVTTAIGHTLAAGETFKCPILLEALQVIGAAASTLELVKLN